MLDGYDNAGAFTNVLKVHSLVEMEGVLVQCSKRR